jgi:hypothetical protein
MLIYSILQQNIYLDDGTMNTKLTLLQRLKTFFSVRNKLSSIIPPTEINI